MNDFFKKKNKKRKKIKEKHLACIVRLFKVDQQEKLKKRGRKKKKMYEWDTLMFRMVAV